jgi:hypothetical protein
VSRSSTREGLGLLGLGAAACAACCAAPILGFLAAVGIGTILGLAAFGSVGLFVAVPIAAAVIRRRRVSTCPSSAAVPVATPGRKVAR